MNSDDLFKVILEEKRRNAFGDSVNIIMETNGCNNCNEDGCGTEKCIRKGAPSEIERMFCMAFMHKLNVDFLDSCPAHPIHNDIQQQFRIQREYKIDKYRCDFLCEYEKITGKKLKKSSVLVELDSQKWHETNEEQRRYEKKRERFIQSKGFNILRFTGKEVMENPFSCVKEVENFLRENQKEYIYG